MSAVLSVSHEQEFWALFVGCVMRETKGNGRVYFTSKCEDCGSVNHVQAWAPLGKLTITVAKKRQRKAK